jgi:hypothetical protein
LDSDGLDYSRRAEEESKLCSVRNDSIGQQVICQTQGHWNQLLILENGSSDRSQSRLLVVLAPRGDGLKKSERKINQPGYGLKAKGLDQKKAKEKPTD